MLKVYRPTAGIGQRELARRTGLARETLARIERGQGTPNVTTARRVADELDVSIAVLFGDQPSDRAAAVQALREAAKQ